MTLAWDSDTSISSSMAGACIRAGSNELVVVVYSGSTYNFRRFTTATGHAQQGSDLPTGSSSINPTSIAMITADKVACISNQNTSATIADLNTLTITNFTSRDSAVTHSKGQLVAGQLSTTIGFGCVDTAGKVIRFDGTAVTATLMTLDIGGIPSGEKYTCVVPKTDATASHFIFGSSIGRIIETDGAGALVHQYMLPPRRKVDRNSGVNRSVVQLAYYKGLVLAHTSLGELYLFEHESGYLLQKQNLNSNNSASSTYSSVVLSNPSGPSVVAAGALNNGLIIPVIEFDIATTPMKHADVKNIGSTADVTSIYTDGTHVAVVKGTSGGSTKIHWMTLSAQRAIQVETVAFTPGGNPTAGELIAIDDTVSPAQVMLHTTIPAAGMDVPLTDSLASVLLIGSYGKGTSRVFDVRRIAT